MDLNDTIGSDDGLSYNSPVLQVRTLEIRMSSRLETMIVHLIDPTTGVQYRVRFLLDTGSSHSFIRILDVKKYHLPVLERRVIGLQPFGSPVDTRERDVVSLKFVAKTHPSATDVEKEIKVISVPRICEHVNSYALTDDQKEDLHVKQVGLSDSEADRDGVLTVDVLIGQDYYHQMVDGTKLHLAEGLVLIPSIGGYVMGGSVQHQFDPNQQCAFSPISICVVNHVSSFAQMTLEAEQTTMDQFVGIDKIGVDPEEKEPSSILDEFNQTIEHTGKRYKVELPKKLELLWQLKTNFPQVFNRLESGWAKLNRPSQEKLKETYVKIMQDQIDLGVLEEVICLGTTEEVRAQLQINPRCYDTIAASKGTPVHYLPHFPVQKASDGSYRLVYDAAAKPYKGQLSLNDCLETGPPLINSLVAILIRFRLKKYACKGDISKAFLQIEVDSKDRDCLRLLWKKDGLVSVYRFARLPFGLTSSPFILAATLKYHLEKSGLDPELVKEILESFYVDDFVYSKDSMEEVDIWKTLTLRLFSEAGMLLRKWNTNHPELRKSFLADEGSLPNMESVLGLMWDLMQDTISINGDRIGKKAKAATTKRGVYYTTAQVFDPLGLLSPFVFQCKLLVRDIWKAGIEWDDPLLPDLAVRWESWKAELPLLNSITLPRHVSLVGVKIQRLVGFCDASGLGFGAMVYLVSFRDEWVVSHLITSRTRIAPAKITEIPRLELCSAVLLANVMAAVQKAIPEVNEEDTYYFSDSADVLYWLWSESISQPKDTTNFIGNRLKKIRRVSKSSQWHHVGTKDNPADIASRGASLSKLKYSTFWLEGPEFIREEVMKPQTHIDRARMPDGVRRESEHVTALMATVDPLPTGLSALMSLEFTNDYRKLIRVTDIVLKAAHLWLEKARESLKKKSSLTTEPLHKPRKGKLAVSKPKPTRKWRHRDFHSISLMAKFGPPNDSEAELRWIREVQQEHFWDVLCACQNASEMASSKSRALKKNLKVFLDPELKVLRVKTRLPYSELDDATINPILLPKESKLTTMIITCIHQRLLHAGVRQTLTALRGEFWLASGRREVSKVVHRCVVCRKATGQTYALPPHPDLPDLRVQKVRPFLHVGLDFAGPFIVTEAGEDIKAYILILTCAVTRAVWFVDTHGLSAYDFMLGFKKFVGRRGVPQRIESDNAKAYECANRKLLAIYKNKEVQAYITEHRIEWKWDWNFYLDKAPWQGGFIERMVGNFKSIAKKVIGSTKMTYMEFATIVVEAEGIVNSRPITYDYSSIEEGQPLSPAKLLYGYDLTEIPPMRKAQHDKVPEVSLTDRYWFMESVKTSLWNRWSKEYLTSLSERHLRQAKSKGVQAVPSIGEVVLLRREKTPRRRWRLARVLEATPNPRDNQVRTCVIKTHNDNGKVSIIERSPSFLVPLELKVCQEVETR